MARAMLDSPLSSDELGLVPFAQLFMPQNAIISQT
jgi:hypothetical protein